MITYAIELVGGRWDAQRGLYWREGAGPAGETSGPPPRVIYVGECPGDGTCLGSLKRCRDLARRLGMEAARHPAYWLPEEDAPPDVTRYVRRGDPEVDAEDGAKGRVVYGKGGMVLPAERETRVELPVPVAVDGPPLVTALADLGRLARELGFTPGRHDRGWPK